MGQEEANQVDLVAADANLHLQAVAATRHQ
jgi:hypothetical protein